MTISNPKFTNTEFPMFNPIESYNLEREGAAWLNFSSNCKRAMLGGALGALFLRFYSFN